MYEIKHEIKKFITSLLTRNRLKFILLGYALIIVVGGFILSLPISSAQGTPTNFLNSLFTATSATCVTGLVVYDTATHWSAFGQAVILVLIQIGGLSFMTMATMFSLLVGRTISLKERMLMVESLNQESIQGIVKLTKHVILGTIIIELIGAVLLSIRFIGDFGFWNGIYKGVFHSISAFCNAGFDVLGDVEQFSSLTSYKTDILVNLVIMVLIISGGLGFSVIKNILINKHHFKKYTLHSKIVVVSTTILLLVGAVLYFLLEYKNKATIGDMNTFDKILASMFMSTTTRTAGYNTISLSEMTTASKFLTLILMFIGGSPGSTAGGIKTTTMAVLIITVFSVIRGNRDIGAFKRSVNISIVMRAVTTLFIGIVVCVIGIMVVSIVDPHISFIGVCFEVISAFGTVGLSLSVTPTLTTVSKLVIIFLMFFGRVGILTVSLAFLARMNKEGHNFKYPEEKVML